MEQQFRTIEEMISFLYGSKNRENLKLKTDTILTQIDAVYKESTEELKGQKMFNLVIILKYYLAIIEEFQTAYEFQRDIIDKHYENYLKENKELDQFFLFLTETELICSMKINNISKELKLMSLLIDVNELSISEEHNINDLTLMFEKEHIEAYGNFLKFLLEKEKIEEKHIIGRLLSFADTCTNNLYSYSDITYYYLLKDIKEIIRQRGFSEFSYYLLFFYNVLLGFICIEDLKFEIELKEHNGEDSTVLKEEYTKYKEVYDTCNEQALIDVFTLFFNSMTEVDVKSYQREIYAAIKTYCERYCEHKGEDIFNLIHGLKKLNIPDFKMFILDQYVCEFCNGCIDFWFDYKQYKKITDLYNLISDNYYGKKKVFDEFYFKFAYSFSEIGEKAIAKQLYQDAINNGYGSSAVYNNLGVFCAEEGDNEGALAYYIKAFELDTENDTAKKNKENTEKAIKEAKKREQQLRNTYFNKVQKYHRSILFTIYKYSEEVTNDLLYDIIKQDKYTLNRNINFLLDNEMLQLTQKGTYIINPLVEKWIDEYVNPTLERQIVKVDNSKLYRPIFYHESEINLYRVLIELFPQHFIFPNMSLKTIFDIDKLRELIDKEVLSYLFMAHVDFAVINTATYFPVLAFEKDSEYNDNEPARINSKYKNQIFKTGGIPLIRLRYNSGMDYERLKQEVKDATKNLILEIESGNNYSEFDLLKEIDKKKFGITNTVIDLMPIQKEWDNIVGPGIAIKSRVIDVEDRILIIEISNDLKPIIEMSRENIYKRILEKFMFINEIRYNWY